MLSITIGVSEKLDENANFYEVITHVDYCCKSSEILNDEMLKDFQIWKAENNILYCQADTETEKLLIKDISPVENIKLYCCPNGETGYTLMLPEEY